MSGFIKRDNFSGSAGGLNPASNPNVGQYGWTGVDQGHYNQLLQYVDECRKIWISLQEKILYVEEILENVQNVDAQVQHVDLVAALVTKLHEETKEYHDQTETRYLEVKPLYEDFSIKYTDVMDKYNDIIIKHGETLISAASAEQSKVEAKASADKAQELVDELQKGQVYRGKWNPHEGAYPDNKGTNSVWDVVLNEGELEFVFDNIKWFWGDRLIYIKDSNEYQQLESGGAVTSVNGKSGAVTLTNTDVGAAPTGFGLGEKMVAIGSGSCNDFVETGWYAVNNATTDTPLGTGPSGAVLQSMKWGGTAVMQTFWNYTSDRTYTRRMNNGVWNPWVEIYNTFNKPTPSQIGALTDAGFTMKGPIVMDSRLDLKTQPITGHKDAALFRDFGNGNVVLAGGRRADDTPGDLYLGYTGTMSGTTGFTTRQIRLDAPMNWKGSATMLIDANGINGDMINGGAIQVQKDSNNVYHTIIGGSDTVNRGRTIVAAGECGKHIADNTTTGAEQVHIGSDDSNMFLHTGLQNGWGGTTHNITKLSGGELYLGKGTSQVYHQGFKPALTDLTSIGGGIRSNTTDVMSMDGTSYSFVTGLRGAHLCGNSYWDGTNWLKYDNAKPSMHVAVENNGEFKIHSSAATSTNPLQLRPFTMDISGNTTITGHMKSTKNLISNDSYAGVEMLIPGKHAAMVYVDQAGGNMRFTQSDGIGTELVPYANFHPSALTFYRNSTFAGSIQALGTIQAANILNVLGTYPLVELHSPGKIAYGIYAEPSDSTLRFVQTNGAGTVAKTLGTFTTAGSLTLSGALGLGSGTSSIGSDGMVYGPIWGGDTTIATWCRQNFAPISDKGLKRNIRPATKSALDVVEQIKFHSYEWKDESLTKDFKGTEIGLIAQEMEAIDPCYAKDINTYKEDGSVDTSVKALDVTNMLALALKAIQELQEEVRMLKEKN